MATQSPFSLLESFLKDFPLPQLQPPIWAVDEVQRRIVLLLNHILLEEPEATKRLARQKGRIVQLQWRSFSMKFSATAAGLLDLGPVEAKPDLVGLDLYLRRLILIPFLPHLVVNQKMIWEIYVN